MAYSSATSARGRGRLGSTSTSSLSSIGTSPATEGGYYSLGQQPYAHQHLQHQHLPQQQLMEQFNPPIDPQLFGINGGTALPEASYASSSVIAGEVVAGGTASGGYSDTERLPSLGISVSGDEEEAEREGRGLCSTVKLEEEDHDHRQHDGQQQLFGTAGGDSTSGGAAGIIQPWEGGREEEEMVDGRRQLRSGSTLDLSEPEIGAHSDTDLDHLHQPTVSASPEPEKEPTPEAQLPPPPPQQPVKRGRGRPRKHPLPVDANNVPIAPTPKKSVTISTPTVTSTAQSTPASAAKSVQKETQAEISAPVKDLQEDGGPVDPYTPVPVFKRGPGRPRGSGNKRKAFNIKKRTSTGTPVPKTPTPQTPVGGIIPDGVVKRGPGRPRKSMLPTVQNADNAERPVPGGATSAEYTPGWRRSVRERRSVNHSMLFNQAALGEEDLKAPVMGQGCLRKLRKPVGHPPGRRARGERGLSEAEEAEESERKAERRGYIGKAELQRIRRAKITSKLQPPISDTEPLPVFPPEYGFKVSYFRASPRSQSPPRSSSAPVPVPEEASPTPSSPRPTTGNNNSSSLPTPPATQSEDETYEPPRKKARVWMGEADEGYEPIACLYTFAPTAEVFRDFEGFIKIISVVGGRQGCVRVTVPKECVPEPNHDIPDGGERARLAFEALVHRPPQQLAPEHAPRGRSKDDDDEEQSENAESRGSSRERYSQSPELELPLYPLFPGDDRNLLNTHQHLSLNKRCSTWNPIYDVTTNRTYAISATDYLSRRDWRDGALTQSPEDVLLTEADTETALIAKGLASLEEENELNKITYSTDNEATPELRSLFSLSDLGLPSLSGNSLFKSEQQVAGIHTPYFYFASPASVFALHMEDYAALSINYHHWGAPKHWVICAPVDSEKLENLIVGMLGLKNVTCDQFIRHASVFVPTWVLERAGVRYTRVLQEPGEMVITFPWAYHEGWNQGLNVAEAIGYGDVGWERWVRGYRVCGKRCPLKPIEMRFPREGFGEGSGDEFEEEEEDAEEEGAQEERGDDEDQGEKEKEGEGEGEEEGKEEGREEEEDGTGHERGQEEDEHDHGDDEELDEELGGHSSAAKSDNVHTCRDDLQREEGEELSKSQQTSEDGQPVESDVDIEMKED